MPVVATRAGGIPELVQHNYTGLLANVQDAVALADAVKTLVSKPILKKQLIDNATQFVQTFSKAQTALQTYQIYLDVLNSK